MQRIDGTSIDMSLPGEVNIDHPVGTNSWYTGDPAGFPLRAQAGTVSGELVEVPLTFDHAEVTAGGQTGWIYAKATGTAATVRLGWDAIDSTWDGFVEKVKSRLDASLPERAGIVEASFLEVAEPLPADIPISTTAPETDLPVPTEFGEIGEYLAANLLAGNQRIDMEAVPNPFSDQEIVAAVIAQTPYAYVQQYSFAWDDDLRVILEVSYEMGADEMRDLQQRTLEKAQQVVSEVVTDGMSDRDKALALNDWIVANAEYDYTSFETVQADKSLSNDPRYAHAWRPDGVLLNGTAVCGGYAETFQVLSEAAGLETVYVTGNVDTGRHAWNKTYWDGQWWVIDTTWNDSTPQNQLFAISDEVALTEWKHVLETEYWTIPTMVGQYATN
jgi:transglutaminase-like putative cysteine protease